MKQKLKTEKTKKEKEIEKLQETLEKKQQAAKVWQVDFIASFATFIMHQIDFILIKWRKVSKFYILNSDKKYK